MFSGLLISLLARLSASLWSSSDWENPLFPAEAELDCPIFLDAIMHDIGDGNTLSNLWYYLVGPLIGAVTATYVYKLTTD